jgi:hypothetical protein
LVNILFDILHAQKLTFYKLYYVKNELVINLLIGEYMEDKDDKGYIAKALEAAGCQIAAEYGGLTLVPTPDAADGCHWDEAFKNLVTGVEVPIKIPGAGTAKGR